MKRFSPGSPPTRFIGRGGDIDQLNSHFQNDRRLITVWGTAGIGKTRLAMEYGERHRKAGGTFIFFDLSEAHTLDDLLAAAATILGVRLQGVRTDEDIDQLGRAMAVRRGLLVVLDNFEQLVQDAATVVSAWMQQAPKARFIVTSRHRLRVQGEASCELLPLRLVDSGDELASEAVQLFMDRATALSPDLEITNKNAQLVAQVVSRLEGIPLAIELAAARIDVLGLRGLLKRLSNRLDTLGVGQRDANRRQATLKSAIAWSWDLLDESERLALAQCTIFCGGFTLEAAEAVLDLPDSHPGALDALQSLRDKSLLKSERVDDEVRFEQYHSVREFAAEALEDKSAADSVAAQHTDYYLAQGQAWAREYARSGAPESLENLTLELENLTAVLEHNLQPPINIDNVLRATLAIQPVFEVLRPLAGHLALLGRVVDAAQDQDPNPALLAGVYQARGNARRLQGLVDAAQADLTLALNHATDAMEGMVLTDLGVLAQQARQTDEAEDYYLQALERLRGVDAKRTEGRVMGNLGALCHDRGHYEKALDYYRKALKIFGHIGDSRMEGIFLANQGVLELEMDQLIETRTHFTRALEILDSVGDRRLTAITLTNLGSLSHMEGDLRQAESCHERALGLLREVGDLRSEALCLGRLGAAKAILGDTEEALVHIDKAEALLDRLDDAVARESVSINRAFVELADAENARIRQDSDRLQDGFNAVRSRIEDARRGTPSLVEQSDDARTAIRILEATLKRLDPSQCAVTDLNDNALLVGPDAQWFRAPHGDWQEMTRRKAARAILARLVYCHQHQPGHGVPADHLIEAGWPGERMVESAGVNRIHVALNQLRKMGLKECITRNDEGYLLDPAVPLQHVALDWRTIRQSNN